MSVNLLNCDCFELLTQIEDNAIDLILTDPPYHISRPSGFTNTKLKKYSKLSMNFGEWDNQDNDSLLFDVLKECYRVLKDKGTLICFYDLWKITVLKDYLIECGFKQLRFIEWLKTNPVPINSNLNYLTNSREIAVSSVKGSNPVFNSKYDNGLYSYPIYHKNDRFHPTQKPLDLFEELILKHSKPNDIVLDCFSGSCTTGVACQNTGRSFIGCEIDEGYYNKSLLRLKENNAQSKLI